MNIMVSEALLVSKAEEFILMLQNLEEIKDHEKDNPALSKVIERNIRTIIHLRTKAARALCLSAKTAWAKRQNVAPT